MKFTKDNVFRPTPEDGFEKGNKKTIIGHLQHLYLFIEDEKGCITMSAGWRKDYEKAEDVLRKAAGLKKDKDLVQWEETITVIRAINLLNKIVKEMK